MLVGFDMSGERVYLYLTLTLPKDVERGSYPYRPVTSKEHTKATLVKKGVL